MDLVTPVVIEGLKIAIKRGWEHISDSIGNRLAGKAKDQWKAIEWEKVEAEYCSRVELNNNRTKLLGNPNPVDIDDAYTDLYVIGGLSGYPDDDYDYAYDAAADVYNSTEQKQRSAAIDLIATHLRLYIFGKPGAGKTTFMKHLAMSAARNKIARIPILMTLRQWPDKAKIEEQLAAEFDVCQFPSSSDFVSCILKEGRALVLLDGLDEIREEGGARRRAVAEIERLDRSYPKIQIVLTCRTAAESFSFDRFKYAELADFTSDQQRTFIGKWFRDPRKLSLFLCEWEKPESSGHRELGKTPLLLALTCLAFDTHYKFAANRSLLYEDATGALLSKWDASRLVQRDEAYAGLSHNRKRQLLAFLAFSLLMESHLEFVARDAKVFVQTFFRQLPLKEWNQGDLDIDVLFRNIEAQHGLIYETSHGTYQYSHLTLHEYFAACYVTADTSGDALKSLLTAENIGSARWEEVMVHVASLLPNSDRFFGLFRIALAAVLRKAVCFGEVLDIVCEQVRGRKHAVDGSVRARLPGPKAERTKEERQAVGSVLREVENTTKAFIRHRELTAGAYEEESVRRARFLLLLIKEERDRFVSLFVDESSAVKAYSQAMQTYSRCIDLAAVSDRAGVALTPYDPNPISTAARSA